MYNYFQVGMFLYLMEDRYLTVLNPSYYVKLGTIVIFFLLKPDL